jgi:hypothetical protein
VVACWAKVRRLPLIWLLLKQGSRQVYQAAKRAWYLRQCMLYLVAYFMLQESEYITVELRRRQHSGLILTRLASCKMSELLSATS